MLAAFILWPLSIVFRGLVFCRILSFKAGIRKQTKLPGMTISVGNLTVGGTGKSPLVIAICRDLLSRGYRPAIVTRGYGAGLSKKERLVILDKKVVLGASNRIPDEAMMQSAALPGVPVIVGADRTLAVTEFNVQNRGPHPTHYIIDDGFQHLRISRNLDILLVDGEVLFGNGRLLPAGPLREALSASSRASLIAVRTTRDGALAEVAQTTGFPVEDIFSLEYRPSAIIPAPHKQVSVSNEWRSKVLLAVGVAMPQRVHASAQKSGVEVYRSYVVGDHEKFCPEQMKKYAEGCSVVLTTAKDYWRDPEVFSHLSIPTMIMDIEVNISLMTKHPLWPV